MALRSVILCRNPIDDPFFHLRAFLQACDEFILLIFSARATKRVEPGRDLLPEMCPVADGAGGWRLLAQREAGATMLWAWMREGRRCPRQVRRRGGSAHVAACRQSWRGRPWERVAVLHGAEHRLREDA
jgi:hypothetical protein